MTVPNNVSVLVVVPAYNAGEHLRELVSRIRVFVCPENLLIVDDGSNDDTRAILEELKVKHLSFRHNQGKGAALKAGFNYAIHHGYRSVLTLDADLQHAPEEIPRFFAVDNGRQVVIGTRNMTLRNMPFERWMTNSLTSIIVSIFSRRHIRDSQSGFRLLPASVLKAIPLRASNYDFESEILFKAGALGCSVTEVPISTIYRETESFINPTKDTLRFIRQIWRRIWF